MGWRSGEGKRLEQRREICERETIRNMVSNYEWKRMDVSLRGKTKKGIDSFRLIWDGQVEPEKEVVVEEENEELGLKDREKLSER